MTNTTKSLLSKLSLPFLIISSAFLNIFNLWNMGTGNTYYAASIKSMLTNFTSFFFVSFDSTNFISVDKPPLSLWLDTISAKIFGYSGMSILLPHAIAGVLVTILTYVILKKLTNTSLIAFLGALVITISPVNVAIYRNNTPDSLLLVFILLAGLFIIKYFDKRKMKYLILSAIMIGLGFNVKMLQAYLILPAIIAAIFLFSNSKIIAKIKNIIVFTLITGIVSCAWMFVVQLTSPDLRPYVGGSTTNSAFELAFGYNGTQRFEGETGVGGNNGFNVGEKGVQRLFTGEMGTQSGWFLGATIVYSIYFLITRFKKLLNSVRGIDIDSLTNLEKFTFLNIIFFITEFIFFSYAGFFHSYYLNIFAVPISFIFAAAIFELVESKFRNLVIVLGLIVSSIAQISLLNQANYATFLIPLLVVVTIILAITFIYQLFSKKVIIQNIEKLNKISKFIIVGSILVLFIAPGIYSAYTTIQGNTSQAIFIGGPSVQGSGMNGIPGGQFVNNNSYFRGMFNPNNTNMPLPLQGEFGPRNFNPQNQDNSNIQDGNNQLPQQNGGAFGSSQISSALLNYLKSNNTTEKYFVGVASSQEATGFMLNYDILNIMNLGGFSGRDQVITLDNLKKKIQNGEIRFFYLQNGNNNRMNNYNFDNIVNPINSNLKTQGGGMFNGNSDITTWITSSCKSVTNISGLYDCKEVNVGN